MYHGAQRCAACVHHCGIVVDVFVAKGTYVPSSALFGAWTNVNGTRNEKHQSCGNTIDREPILKNDHQMSAESIA